MLVHHKLDCPHGLAAENPQNFAVFQITSIGNPTYMFVQTGICTLLTINNMQMTFISKNRLWGR